MIPRRARQPIVSLGPSTNFRRHGAGSCCFLRSAGYSLRALHVDELRPGAHDAVYSPFGSGCGTILTYPLKEAGKEQPHAILGMFDVSARPMFEKDILTLAMPYSVFLKLLENVLGSFLETESWKKVLQRIQNKPNAH